MSTGAGIMVNPGAFRGPRREFLLGEKAAYGQAVMEGYTGEAVANIQRRYFKRFPIDLPHDQDPTPEQLQAVDDEEVEPELEEPDPTKMLPEEFKAALSSLEARQKLIEFRKAVSSVSLRCDYPLI